MPVASTINLMLSIPFIFVQAFPGHESNMGAFFGSTGTKKKRWLKNDAVTVTPFLGSGKKKSLQKRKKLKPPVLDEWIRIFLPSPPSPHPPLPLPLDPSDLGLDFHRLGGGSCRSLTHGTSSLRNLLERKHPRMEEEIRVGPKRYGNGNGHFLKVLRFIKGMVIHL